MDRYTSADIATLLGYKLGTWRSYVAKGYAPKADGYIDKRTPYWNVSTIDAWIANRPIIKINRKAYEEASYVISKGGWVVDPTIGTILPVPGYGSLQLIKNRLSICFKGRDYKWHFVYVSRVIWEYVNGYIPDNYVVDHINRNTLDNRIENLRCVTQLKNNENRGGKMTPNPLNTSIHKVNLWRK